jgi:hypothetical protein
MQQALRLALTPARSRKRESGRAAPFIGVGAPVVSVLTIGRGGGEIPSAACDRRSREALDEGKP